LTSPASPVSDPNAAQGCVLPVALHPGLTRRHLTGWCLHSTTSCSGLGEKESRSPRSSCSGPGFVQIAHAPKNVALFDFVTHEDGWVGSWRGDAGAFRFQSPPVEPCMRLSRTRLTDALHRRCCPCLRTSMCPRPARPTPAAGAWSAGDSAPDRASSSGRARPVLSSAQPYGPRRPGRC